MYIADETLLMYMPYQKKRFYRFLKWISLICIIVFALLAIAAWYVNIKSRPFISEQIKTLLYKSTDGLYNISFSQVTTNVITGSATLQNVKITPDTNRFNQLIALKRAPNNLYILSLKKLVIKHFHPIRLYQDRKLSVDEVIFDQPDILMMNRQFGFNDNRPPRPIQSPYSFISRKLKSFGIKTIRFKDVGFKYINKNLPNQPVYAIDDLNITLSDFLIDSTSWTDPNRTYLLKDVVINLKDYVYPTPDKMYNIKLNQLDFRASTGKLRIKAFELEPLYDEMKFAAVGGFARDRYHILMSDLLLKGINLPKYVSKQELWAKEMTIADGSVSVFNNNSYPAPPSENKLGKFPHQLLQKVPELLFIEKILLKDININYGVYNKESAQRGAISFEHTTGTIKNATNMPRVKSAHPIMEADLSTYVMGQGKLDVNFKFDLNAKNGDFSYNGILHDFNAKVLNKITKPLGLVRINRGNVDNLKFDFKADEYGAKGIVNFSYYDLSVALMRVDPEKDHLVTRGLISILANALIINSENPGPDGKFISAKVNYSRPANTSFFSLLWRSLFTGIKYSVGITEEKQNEVREHIELFKTLKHNHLMRKKKRMERRQQKLKEEAENR